MSCKLLSNGTILAFDADSSSVSVLTKAHLLIKGDTITHISSDISSIEVPADTETVDCTNKILSPGFIDTHRHVWQTAFRSLGPNVTLCEYFSKYSAFGSAKDAYTADDIYTSTVSGYIDALNSGVTTVLDHAHNSWSKEVAQAGLRGTMDSGVRAFWCWDPASIGGRAWDYADQVSALTTMTKEVRASPADDLVKMGIAFDTIERADEDRISSIKQLIKTLSLEVITTHLLEGPWPIGNNTPTLANKRGLLDLNTPMIFSHGGFISDTDISLLRSKNHHLSITPESEFHYGHGSVTSHKCLDHASLGVDTNWTFSSDLLTQARLQLQTTRNKRYEAALLQNQLPAQTPMTVEQAFLLATRQGALALRKHDLGILAPGAKADIAIFNTGSPNMVGYSDAIAAIVLHANVGDITDVLVGGEWRKRDGNIVGLYGGREWSDIKKDFVKTARKVQDHVKKLETEMPNTLFGVPLGDVERVSLDVV